MHNLDHINLPKELVRVTGGEQDQAKINNR